MDRHVTHDQEQWQLDGTAAELYQRYLVPSVTAIWAANLVDRAALQPGERVLDVACGTGVVARLAAERVSQTGRVAALDLNLGMLAVARALPPGRGATIDWHEGTALALPFPDAMFDVAFCQLGLQFFPDRPKALRELRRVLMPSGRLALNVYGPIEHNPATYALANALDVHCGPAASVAKRTEHALADTAHLLGLLADAGFHGAVISTTSELVRFPSPADYVRVQLAATPLASVITQLDAAGRERLTAALVEDVGAALESYVGDAGLTFPQEVHSVLASR